MPGIASLLPSATQIVIALGLADRLVAVTDECIAPRDVPVVVRARQPVGMDAGAIDEWVREHAGDGLYDVDEVTLARLNPDVVLTQDLCHVCALPAGDVDRAMQRVGCPSQVVTLAPSTLPGVLQTVRDVATAAGQRTRGEALVCELEARLDAVAIRVAHRPKVPTLVLEWLDPPYAAGHWVPDVVAAAGGTALLGRPGARSGPIKWDDAVASRPDVVVLSPCGTSVDDAWTQAETLPEPLRSAELVVLDLAQPGTNLIDAVEQLADVLHPASGEQRSAAPEHEHLRVDSGCRTERATGQMQAR